METTTVLGILIAILIVGVYYCLWAISNLSKAIISILQILNSHGIDE